jgi:hypothetical protein
MRWFGSPVAQPHHGHWIHNYTQAAPVDTDGAKSAWSVGADSAKATAARSKYSGSIGRRPLRAFERRSGDRPMVLVHLNPVDPWDCGSGLLPSFSLPDILGIATPPSFRERCSRRSLFWRDLLWSRNIVHDILDPRSTLPGRRHVDQTAAHSGEDSETAQRSVRLSSDAVRLLKVIDSRTVG